MKHINKLSNILIIPAAVLLIFTACQNDTPRDTENTVVEPVETTADSEITIKGEIKLHGAAPSRAATTSFDSDYTWQITAMKKELMENDAAPTAADTITGMRTKVTSTNNFTIDLPSAGDWVFIIYGFAGTYTQSTLPSTSAAVFMCYDDSHTIKVDGTDPKLTFYPTVYTSSLVMTNDGAPITGNINLLVSCESENVSWVSAVLTKSMNPESEPVEISSAGFTNGKSSLVAFDIPVGLYTAKILFEDNVGNTLYTCNEAISVYPGLTTDTWFGTAPYLNNGTFTLTGSLIDLYGAEVVPDTQTVLYDYDSETRWSYSFANSDSLLDDAYNQADFCFDSNGNVYLGTCIDMMQFYYYDVSKKQVYQIQVLDSDNEETQITSSGFLDYDFAKNQLWFVTAGILYKFSQLNENSPDSYSANVTVYNFRTADLGVGSLLSACIYNDKAYLVYSTVDNQAVPFILLEYDISSAEVDEEDPTQFYIASPKATKELCAGMGLSSYAEITDMLYQDGAAYILVRDYNFDNQDTKISRGAVLRYNTLTGSLDSIGFADAVDNASLANAKISAYNYIFNDDAYKPLYNEEALTTPWLVNADKAFTDSDSGEQKNLYNGFPGIFTPAIASSISTKQFYGPSKFVAVKPKKLVIADDGLAFYIDNDVLKYKNVNRIVTVDLNSFSIVGTEDAAVNFSGESRDEIELLNVSNSTSYQNAMADEVFPKYYENNGTSINLTSVAAGTIYLAVPCGD